MMAAIEKYAQSVMCLVEAVDDIAVGILACVGAYSHIKREPIIEEVESDCIEIHAFLATFLCRRGKYSRGI